ncbi:hypothetical protein [Novosphingobium gossypii]|uniref:hypothetical protein n=1 Tax=Novosphingobium gossypii TaxID=1604774 RepID=UPI003D1A4A48
MQHNIGGILNLKSLSKTLFIVTICASSNIHAKDIQFYLAEAFGNRAIPTENAEIKRAHQYTDCLIDYPRTIRIMSRKPASRASSDAIWNLAYASPECNKDAPKIQYGPNALRGALAEHLLRKFVSDLQVARRTKLSMLYDAPSAAEMQKLPEQVRASVTMVEYGSCVANADWDGVFQLFATEAASSDETRAFASLNTAMSNCLAPSNNIKLTKFQLRGFLAEGALRNAVRKNNTTSLERGPSPTG